MRFIRITSAQNGMVLAKSLYNNNNQLLLSEGLILKQEYIQTIRDLGYSGIYIQDELSKDIEIPNLIDQRLKIEAVVSLKKLFVHSKRENHKQVQQNITKMIEIVESIVDEILDNPQILVNVIDLKNFDNYTFYHSVNVSTLATIIGTAMGLARNDLVQLATAGMLHDIGKQFIDIDILNKTGKLTEAEFTTVKQHSKLGYQHISEKYDFSAKVNVGILQHHENYNGTGYPNGLKGEEITLYGRILRIVDVYDALVSKRPYHDPYQPSEALEYLMGSEEVDKEILKIFLSQISPYPIGTTVKLSDSREALVVENFAQAPLRPKVRMLDGSMEEVNLYTDPSVRNITIVSYDKE